MAADHVYRVFRVKMSEEMARKMEEHIAGGDFVSYADEIRQAINLLISEAEIDGD